MKKYLKIIGAGLASVAVLGFSSCTTTYDAYGRPVQTVDPGAAVLGAVAIGAVGYAIGQNNSHDYDRHRGHHSGHHHRRHYHRRHY
jgi:hypothetical protein